MYGEQKNTRLCRVTMVAVFDIVLYGADTSDHGIGILIAMAQYTNQEEMTTCVKRNTYILNPMMAS